MRVERLLLCVVGAAALLAAPRLRACGTEETAPSVPAGVRAPGQEAQASAFEIDFQARVKDVELVERDGQLYVRPSDQGGLVPAEAWLRALAAAEEEQRAKGFLYVLLNITKPWSLVWIAVGLGGQALFMLRMLLQWYASEKQKRSVIPVGFWWGSLFGGILLFAYFVWRKDIVGILGQSTGIVVYARNLVLIHRRVEAARTPPVPAETAWRPASSTGSSST